MELDPAGGEAELRKLQKRRRVLDALMAYYQFKKMPEKATAIAAEAIRIAWQDSSRENSTLRVLASTRPLEAIELFGLIADDPAAQRGIMDSASGLFTGLFRAAETQVNEVARIIAPLRGIVEADGFATQSGSVVTLQYVSEGRKVDTSTNRETLAAYLDLLEQLVDPDSRDSARAALPTLSTRQRFSSPGGRRRPVDAALPLPEAVEKIQALDPPDMRLPELWRYLIGKPRSEQEARPILAKLVEWAGTPGERDPFGLVSSLLNLDGRMPGWQLPAGLRPMVFQAAVRLGPSARDTEALMPLVEAMREENVDPPAEAASALARLRLIELRSALEARYHFSLPSLDGRARTLQSARGKVVVLNFWATSCGPCREEMTILAAVKGQGVEVMAITDEPLEKVRGFVEKHPLDVTALVDTERKTFAHYRVMSLPQTFVLDPHGGLVKHFLGPVTEQGLRAAINSAGGQK